MKNLTILVALLAFFSACDIDRLPETQLNDERYWANANDLMLATNYLYTFLPGLPENQDNMSDDGFAMAANTISDGSRIPPATDANFNTPYQVIRAANNIIENSGRVTEAGGDTAAVSRYTKEAKFFRAFFYFELIKRYGDVPLITTTLQLDSPELEAPASARAEVLELIYNDLNEAETLPAPSELGEAEYGRITNNACLALKARVALFEGTRGKFHQDGEPESHLKIAMEAAKKVMDSEEHGLFNSYYDLFQYAGEGPSNKETILAKVYGVSRTNNILSHFATGQNINGNCNPTRSLVDAFLMKDGLPIEKSPLYKKPGSMLALFANRDERLGATVMKPGDVYTDTAPYVVANFNFQPTGFCPRQYVDGDDFRIRSSYIDKPLIRYAEVLLTFAEAKFELDESISDEDLNLSINLLRNRGKIAPLTNAFIKKHNLSMREEIRRERRVELVLQGFRYWDLLRWKTAEVELPKAIMGCYYFADEFSEEQDPPKLTEDNYIMVQEAGTRRFDPEKDYLWPFPVNELALNPQLKQNPKW